MSWEVILESASQKADNGTQTAEAIYNEPEPRGNTRSALVTTKWDGEKKGNEQREREKRKTKKRLSQLGEAEEQTGEGGATPLLPWLIWEGRR